jgi:hypothetical protein
MVHIKLGKIDKEVAVPSDLATNLEFTIMWSHASEDPTKLLRLCCASIGVALHSLNLLPAYRPDADSILVYGRKILGRLLEKNVNASEIYNCGSAILASMASSLPEEKEVKSKMDFFPSSEEGD